MPTEQRVAIAIDNRRQDHQYLLDRFSQSLTKYDTQALFEKAIKRTGSLAAATKEAELTRKTVYDWDKTSDEIKATTKRKILQASLEADYYGTLEFLNRKTDMEHKEVLERYINSRVEHITNISDRSEFEKNRDDLMKFLKLNTGTILDLKNVHVNDLIKTINEKAHALGTGYVSSGVEFTNPSILSRKFMLLLEAISLKTMLKEEMANKINLPEDFIEQACKVARYIDPVGHPRHEFEHGLALGNLSIDAQKIGYEHRFEEPFNYFRAKKHC